MEESKCKNQLEYISEQIINGKNKDYFKVIDTEPGLGKTKKVEETLAELYKINPNIKTLFVKKFIDSGEYSSYNRINQMADKEIAVAISKNNIDELKNKLDKYNVVIITHERYKILSHDLKQREIFTNGRKILIIDEMINMLNIYSYNKTRIEWFYNLLPREIHQIYNKCIEEIENYIISKKQFTFFNAKNNPTKELYELQKLIKYNITKEYTNKFDTTKYTLLNEVNIIQEFYNKTCVVDNTGIHTYDGKINYWLLDNNIILDANGGFNYLYQLSDLFKIQRQSKILDHSKWNIHVADINTTKSKKQKATNFYEQIGNHVKSIIKPNDKMLIVGNLSDDELIFKKIFKNYNNIDINHFLNIIGRNDWKDYNKIYLTHTPNTPFYVYVLNYLFYTKKKLDNRSNWNLIKKNNKMIFVNNEYNKVRITYLAGEIYQAIKRIDRNVQFNSEIYILNNDSNVIELVIKQMKNIKKIKFNLDIEYSKQNKVLKETYVDKFIKLCNELPKGKYKKSYIKEQLGINNQSYFTQKILNNTNIIKYMEGNNIINSNKYIILN